MALIETSDFESVRKLISTNLTSATLPDSVIGLVDYKSEAERRVSIQTSNEDDSAKRAARAFLAALLIPALPKLIKQNQAGYSYEMEKTDWGMRIAELEAIAASAIADSELLNPTDIGSDYLESSNVPSFDVAESYLSDKYIY